jgi:hypothetical protein
MRQRTRTEFRKGAVGEALRASLFPAFPTQRPPRDGHHWSRGRSVRVVDDDPECRELATRLFAASGSRSEKLTASRRRVQSKASAVLVDVELHDGDLGSRSRVKSPRFRGTGGSN